LLAGVTSAVQTPAHKLAGAAAAIGASAISGLALEIESMGKCADLTKARQKQQQLAEEFAHLLAMLTKCG
jgi:HPt (histidine-containing phosphotransfer) domain-containing protein